MCADNPCDNREPQPTTTAPGWPPGRISAVKALKDMRLMLRGNADAGITHEQAYLRCGLRDRNPDLSARIRITDRVIEQIYDYLDQTGLISHKLNRMGDLYLKLDGTFSRELSEGSSDGFYELIKLHRFPLKVCLSFIAA